MSHVLALDTRRTINIAVRTPRRRRAPHVPRVSRIMEENLRCAATGAIVGSLAREVALGGRVSIVVNAPGRELAVGRGRNLREAISWLIQDATGRWTLTGSNAAAMADLDQYLECCGLIRA